MRDDAEALVTHQGGCHCGRVRYEVDAPRRLDVQLCDCSICSMTSYLHLIVPTSRFRLVAGSDELLTYGFNTMVARHHFCRTCGIKSFYVPRSNPDGISVNARCLDPSTIEGVRVTHFDGRRWELHAHELARLSQDVGGGRGGETEAATPLVASGARGGLRYHHVGIPTPVPHEDEVYLEEFGMYTAGFATSPYGVEWMRFDEGSPLPELVRTVPHVAFEVDDLEEALVGREVLIEPNSPSPGVRVAFVRDNGAPIELLQIDADQSGSHGGG
jgi:hypothetical protein